VWRLDLAGGTGRPTARRHLVVDWAGDVAQLRHDGVVVADRFWDGDRWLIRVPERCDGEWTLHISPLRAGTGVGITERMAARLQGDDDLCALDGLRLEESTEWTIERSAR
jgi:beta-galactosidase